MDLELTEDQAVLLSSVESLLKRYSDIPVAERRNYYYYASDLERSLATSGFLDVVRTMGTLEAVLVAEAVSRIAPTVEVAASILVAPQISNVDLPRPLALISGDIMKAQRFLPNARAALYDVGDDLLLIDLVPGDVEEVESIFAYPYGRFRKPPDLTRAHSLGDSTVQPFRHWRNVALAAEVTGAMSGAIDFTVEYVKQRQMFGHALGLFQAVQHRLAQCHQIATASRYLTYHAAWSRDALDAELAAVYAQQHIPKVFFDVHQFNGAMGITNEHMLHCFTYRLRALQAEMGGSNEGALRAADAIWPTMAKEIRHARRSA